MQNFLCMYVIILDMYTDMHVSFDDMHEHEIPFLNLLYIFLTAYQRDMHANASTQDLLENID